MTFSAALFPLNLSMKAPAARLGTSARWKTATWYLAALGLVSAIAGLVLGLLLAPASAQQGETYRIILVHVPASWLSMLIYVVMALCATSALVTGTRAPVLCARALAPTGAGMAALSLGTGALWGRPTWGAWWAWDARVTSELILLLFLMGFIALMAVIGEARRAERAGGFWLLAGAFNIPIIHFSVQWWPSLHQSASIVLGKPAPMSPFMVWGVLLMVLAFSCYAATMALLRLRHLAQAADHALA